MKNTAIIVQLASLFALLGVAMGAFAAHGLKSVLPIESIETVKTAVFYQLIHALAALVVMVLSEQEKWIHTKDSLVKAGWCFLLGIVLFSGSLYGLVLFKLSILGPVTPIGGVLFILGWGTIVYAARR